ncbi:MAG: hypothetical protein P4L84_01125 [Isosphaeraceae bacterium]|nr:hypothetical protein [Isosphaeraceae bacterium]
MRRFSVAQVMGIIGALGLGCAALRSGAEVWFQWAYFLTLATLSITLLGALIGTPPRGAWLGFTLFGWGYFVLIFVPAVRSTVGVHLPDTGLLDGLAERCHQLPSRPSGAMPYASDKIGDFFLYNRQLSYVDPNNAVIDAYYKARRSHTERVHYSQGTCYLLACWTAGVIGAVIGRALARPPGPAETSTR